MFDRDRDICFEDIVAAIDGGGLLDDIEHPYAEQYRGQRILVVFVQSYVYAVPYVATLEEIFLKTACPSRHLKARYMPALETGKEGLK